MLIYHPAYDAYHCVFRMLVIADSIKFIELDKARLIDFYLLFPSAIGEIRLPYELSLGKRMAKDVKNPYRDPIDSLTSFRELHQIQVASLKCIAASGLISMEKFSDGIVERTSRTISKSLLYKMEQFLADKGDIANFLLNDLSIIPLNGVDGLKHRTRLMEYRYDIN